MNLKQRMREVWPSDRWSLWCVVLLVVLNVAGWASIWYIAPRDLDVSPLHYTIYFGINLTGSWVELFWLPAIGAMAIASHIVIARLVKHTLWVRLWLLLAVVINLMMLVDLAAILILLRTASF